MALLVEKDIRAYHLKGKGKTTIVCPPCATDEERAAAGPEDVIAEDVIHDTEDPMFCARCQKKIN